MFGTRKPQSGLLGMLTTMAAPGSPVEGLLSMFGVPTAQERQQQALMTALYGSSDAMQPNVTTGQGPGGVWTNPDTQQKTWQGGGLLNGKPMDLAQLGMLAPGEVVGKLIDRQMPAVPWNFRMSPDGSSAVPVTGSDADPRYKQTAETAVQLGKNLQGVGPNGVISNLPGAVQSEAEKTGAIEAAKAGAQFPFKLGEIGAQGAQNRQTAGFNADNELIEVRDPATGATVKVPRSVFFPTQAPQGAAPSIVQPGPANGPTGRMPQPAEPLPPAPPGVMPQASPIPPNAPVVAPSGRSEAIAGMDKARLEGMVKEAEAQRGTLAILDQAEKLINEGALGNGIIDRGKMAAHSIGIQSPESINTALIQQLGDKLVLARGSLGAGVSVSDAERYDRAAGDFSKAQSNEQRLGAIQIMRDIAGKQFETTNKALTDFSQTGRLPQFQAPQSAATPTPSTPLKGQVIDGYRFKGGNPADPNSWERK